MAEGLVAGGSGARRRRPSLTRAVSVLASALALSTAGGSPAGDWSPLRVQPEGRGLDRVPGATTAAGGAALEGAAVEGAASAPPPRTGPDGCTARALRPDEGFDAFYGQVCWADELAVVASAEVDGRALSAAADIVNGVLALRPDLRRRIEERGVKVAVLGRRERAVDLPEYRDLPERYPEEDWDAARAYSATAERPVLTAPEENLACQAADTYPGQQVLVHELGHSVLDLAVRPADPAMWGRVVDAHRQAVASGRWVGYYGSTSAAEYWAEGVQAYFDAGARSEGPDPYGTPAATREHLAGYDPALYELVRRVFGDNPWRAPRCR